MASFARCQLSCRFVPGVSQGQGGRSKIEVGTWAFQSVGSLQRRRDCTMLSQGLAFRACLLAEGFSLALQKFHFRGPPTVHRNTTQVRYSVSSPTAMGDP